jgi:hypothetical protein
MVDSESRRLRVCDGLDSYERAYLWMVSTRIYEPRALLCDGQYPSWMLQYYIHAQSFFCSWVLFALLNLTGDTCK